MRFESLFFENMFIRFTPSHVITPFLLIFFLQLHFHKNIHAAEICPIDFSYVGVFPWDASLCHEPVQSLSSCCQSLRSLFGVGLALYLKQSSMFYLPDVNTSSSCIASFGQKLESSIPMSGSGDFFQSCLNDKAEFVNKGPASDSSCAGIVTTDDWVQKVGKSSIPLESSCNGDMTGLGKCSLCQDAGMKLNSYLVSLHPNSTKCFFFAILYAAAIINDFGPDDARTASCILALPLSHSKNPKPGEKTLKFVIFGLVGGLVVALVAAFLFLIYRKRDKKRKLHLAHENYVNSVKSKVTSAKWFQMAELEQATNGFSQKNLIGQGGYGIVYKGTLFDGAEVAVKEILDLSFKGDDEFINEVEIISTIRHRNLLALKGFCVSSDSLSGKRRYLVYDFMSNGSLDDNLFNSGKIKTPLSWSQRKNIILDVAKGIAYLHNGIKPAIYHRDIKATNILLDSDMKARVSDFGLARQSVEGGPSHITTRVAGTYGYLAPEYALYGQLTDKIDVYSFGILILEIMSGRKVLDGSEFSKILITDWAWELVKSGRVEEVLDGCMRDEGRKGVMERFVLVGVLCGHVMVALRPTIADALRMLEGDMDIPTLPERCSPLTHGLFLHDSR